MATHQTQAELAYHLWEARGCPSGSAEIDWLEAGRQIYGSDAAGEQRKTPPVVIAEMMAPPAASHVGPLSTHELYEKLRQVS